MPETDESNAEGNENEANLPSEDDLEVDDASKNDDPKSRTSENKNQCDMCTKSEQHKCRKCDQPVCNLFCSVQDPSSTNEIHIVHKQGDIRCGNQSFECPSCSKLFKTALMLQEHVEEGHPQVSSLSLISEANSSSWMHVCCTVCEKKFENESDMTFHRVRVHEYGEICQLYPCEECGFSGGDVQSLKDHIENEHSNKDSSSITVGNLDVSEESQDEKLLVEDLDESFEVEKSSLSEIFVQKRRVQNLKDINFDEDSDDDKEWSPSREEDTEVVNDTPIKKTTSEYLSCEKCEFSTKYEYNLKRHSKTHEGSKRKNTNLLEKDVSTSIEKDQSSRN